MNKTVKGFTLTELIVVMAIFGVIMAAAMQMIQPVSKTLQLADAHENGNAVVSNISSYIKGQVSPAEFVTVHNEVPYDGSGNINMSTVDGWVHDYATTHYRGIVKGGTNANSPAFADGTIHVLFIENNENGRISTVTYDNVVFGSGTPPFSTGGAPPVFTVPAVSTANVPEIAVNKAYYDNYDIQIKFGNYENITAFDAAMAAPDDFSSMASNINSKNTVFTIKATKHQTASEISRGATPISFLEHSAMSLVNIYNKTQKSGKYMRDCYYLPWELQEIDAEGNLVYEADGSTPKMVNGFMDIADPTTHPDDSYGDSVILDDGGSSNGYCLIYSYSSEINTRP